jgi:hypothetical protein
MGLRRFNRTILAARLERFEARRDAIIAMVGPLLEELAGAVRTLEERGFPFSLEELGVPRRAGLLAVRNVGLLRHRYSGFDIAYELGLSGELREAASGAL